jgi:hypothetical protein
MLRTVLLGVCIGVDNSGGLCLRTVAVGNMKDIESVLESSWAPSYDCTIGGKSVRVYTSNEGFNDATCVLGDNDNDALHFAHCAVVLGTAPQGKDSDCPVTIEHVRRACSAPQQDTQAQ